MINNKINIQSNISILKICHFKKDFGVHKALFTTTQYTPYKILTVIKVEIALKTKETFLFSMENIGKHVFHNDF